MMATETATEESEEQRTDLVIRAQEGMAQKEIEGALFMAAQYPRNEEAAFARVAQSCKRWAFAVKVSYNIERAGRPIEGASVDLAREIARCWGNLRYGADVIYDDEETRTVRAWAWDLQTNTKGQQDVTFRKVVFRKKTGWRKCDDNELREITNSYAGRAVRNCILNLLPPDLVDDMVHLAKETIVKDAGKDPADARKKLVIAFAAMGVTVEELEGYLEHPVRQITEEEVAKLRGIWKSISDGNSVWSEYSKTPATTSAVNGPVSIDDLTGQSETTEPPEDEAADE